MELTTILSSDATAVDKRNQIYLGLGLPYADLKYFNKNMENASDFFNETLYKWSGTDGSSATVENFVAKLKKLTLISSAGK